MSEYKSLLRSANNTRAVDGIRPSAALWRSGAVSSLSCEDIVFLRENGITDFIDLRTDEEVRRKPCTAGEYGFRYHLLPITEGSVPPKYLEDVPLSYMKIAASENMAVVFRCIAQADGGVQFFCTAGKDRTGVVSAVLQMLCGVDRGEIVRGYTVSREYNMQLLENYLAAHPEIDRRAVLANECSMEDFIEMFIEKYGSAKGYIEKLGLSGDTYESLMKKLSCDTEGQHEQVD